MNSDREEDDGSEDDDPHELESRVSHRVPTLVNDATPSAKVRQKVTGPPDDDDDNDDDNNGHEDKDNGAFVRSLLSLAYPVAHVSWQVCGRTLSLGCSCVKAFLLSVIVCLEVAMTKKAKSVAEVPAKAQQVTI